jgi:hypothetical protein
MAGDASTDDRTDDLTGDRLSAGAGVGAGATADTDSGCPFSPPAAPGSPARPKRGYLLPGTIALVVCAVIATVIDLAGLQSRTPSSLAGRQVETFLSQSLQANHPQQDPPQVRCPAEEPLRAGLSFDCTLLSGGRPVSIQVTETSGHGTFRYRPPVSR